VVQNEIAAQLQEAIHDFDGKDVAVLEAFLTHVQFDEELADLLLELALLADAQLQIATTWLLKRGHEQGGTITSAQAARMVGLLGQTSHWQARLHLLQLFAVVPIPSASVDDAFTLFLESTDDQNKFVRAWAYNGLSCLATAVPAFRGQVAALLMRAQHEESASVRARIRHAVKAAKWLTDARA